MNLWETDHIQTTAPWHLVWYTSPNMAFGDTSSELSVSRSETFAADQRLFAPENCLGPQ